jgi:nicotinamidase-related amidase
MDYKIMKAAVLIIDVLQDFFKEGRLKDHRNQLATCINELVQVARDNGLPIIWVRQEFKDDLSDAFLAMKKSGHKITIAGTEGCQLLPEIHREKDDDEIVKKRYSAFYKTELDDLLARLKVDTLILVGVNTHACVRTTAVDAYQRDYEVILATDCIDSYDEEYHNVSLRYLTTTIAVSLRNEEIKSMITS